MSAELDLQVAKIADPSGHYEIEEDGICWEHNPPDTSGRGDGRKILAETFQPSTEWHTGGPLIEEYGISTIRQHDGTWTASLYNQPLEVEEGKTPLEAAMRALVAALVASSKEES